MASHATRICRQGRLWFKTDGAAGGENFGLNRANFGRTAMMKFLGAVAILAMVTAPALAHSRHHRYHHYEPLVSYLHNYGPGPTAGTYAYYDGPLRANCKQSAAAYRGQDGRAHPCH
jgi:hypothetical protein